MTDDPYIREISRIFTTEKGETIEALSRVSLKVRDHEFICILRSVPDAGKPRSSASSPGLESATSGTISLNDMTITKPSPYMAMIFQEYSLYPWRNVLDNVGSRS